MTDHQTDAGKGVPWYFWVIGAVALAWNALGTLLWAGTSFMPDTFLEGQSAPYREYVDSLPIWSMLSWGLGVVGGVVGSALFLLRKARAVPVLALSLFGAVVNQGAYLTNPPPEGFVNPGLVLFIIGFAGVLLWVAHLMRRRGLPG